jgi:hypothetical protein
MDFLTSPKVPDASTDTGAAARRQVGDQFKAPTNWYVFPQHVLSATASVLTSDAGKTLFVPIRLNAGTYDAIAYNVTTAQSGGATTFSVALYPEDPTTGLPKTDAGPLASGTGSLAATGNVIVTFTGVVLPAGNYYLASLYVITTAPTTPAQLPCISNNTAPLPWSAWVLPSTSRGRTRTGTALPTDATTTANIAATGLADVPFLGIRKSA